MTNQYQYISSYIEENDLIGKPIAIRHNLSGVWIGRLKGIGILPNYLVIEGVRVWSWSGGRLEFSELCAKGTQSGDRIGVWTTQHIPIGGGDQCVELTFDVEEKVVAAAQDHAS